MTKASHGGRRPNQTGRPRTNPDEKLVKASVALNKTEREKVRAQAAARQTSMNDVIRAAIRALPDPT